MLKEQKLKLKNRDLRKIRTRSHIQGTEKRPRLSVFISHKHVNAQLIDDRGGQTLAYVSTVGAKVDGSLKAKAEWAGTEIAKQAQKRKIKQVVFDRGKRIYRARLNALAEAARKNGLEF